MDLGPDAFVDAAVGALVPFGIQNIGNKTIPINVGSNTAGGLWGLSFGNGVTGDTNTLYFADGVNGEASGLFGAIAFVAEPATLGLLALVSPDWASRAAADLSAIASAPSYIAFRFSPIPARLGARYFLPCADGPRNYGELDES